MKSSFEEWARAEISRHRTEAEVLERALEKYLESQPKERAVTPAPRATPRPMRAPPKGKRMSKRGFVLSRIATSGALGISVGGLFDAIQTMFPDMKRSSLRALLYLENREGNITRLENGRYVSPENKEGSDAPTSGPAKLF
jgi:hypothetical protein